MALTVYIDETGDGQPPIFAMAGYIARAEQWKSFTNEWRAQLQREPAMDAFHMNEAVSTGKINRLPSLMAVTKAHVITGIYSTVRNDDFNWVMSGKVDKPLDNPYIYMFGSIIMTCVEWQRASGINEPMDFIFDEKGKYSGIIDANWSQTVANMPGYMRERIGGRPIHVDDVRHPPLQAADILAWSIRRRAYCAENQGLQEDEFLRSVLNNEIPRSGSEIQRSDLKEVYGLMKHEATKNGGMFPHEAKIISDFSDRIVDGVNRNSLAKATEGVVELHVIQAKQMGRFLLVNNCPALNIPHLHKRQGDQCLHSAV